jgi:hypothetical protein
MIKKILQKALKPKSTIKKINERLKKAKQTKGIKGAKEEFKARDEKKLFEKRQTEALLKKIKIKEAKDKAARKGKGAIKSKKETSFKDARQVKKGLKIVRGGKGKYAKAKPVGTPDQRAKAAEKRMELKLDRLVEEALQQRINDLGDPDMIGKRFAKGGMTIKKKTKYMAKGGTAKKKMMGGGYAMKKKK